MHTLGEVLVALLIVAGSSFTLIGSIGLVKLPDLMMRLHAPTKATTAGVGGVLLASMSYAFLRTGELSAHELLITLFLFLTAPVTAHFLAKAYLHRHPDRVRRLPPACREAGWARFEPSSSEEVRPSREQRPQRPPRV
ncbi:MAG: Na+/H+ antiporter subunit G [Aromatoleum sp.]|jgi:multicomponent K+:H+ antiporter subunit G|uniref:Na+/H+ antiporter subunit G n=1 Tax=Aromatoleum sp. TaxID=2307007 RepID=UPI002893D969|nr:Na+/H+ antiporter subunit G [Aromatoleum sp.]MDT3670381.1 Na+/H+ antiporter subunit G [Aromatoleum sp.]